MTHCTQSKIGFLPHMEPHVVSQDEVALLSEETRFVLQGTHFARLAPLLVALVE